MAGLSSHDVLFIWEQGQQRHPIDQALIMLTAALPETPWPTLAQLTIGQRNEQLLRLRAETFGSIFDGRTPCPNCGEWMEFSLDLAGLVKSQAELPANTIRELDVEGFTVDYRLPDSYDLAAITAIPNLLAARRALIARCIVSATREDKDLDVNTLPEMVIQKVAQTIVEQDSLVEIRVELVCAACEHRWFALLDMVSFFWLELANLAQRLLDEVHTLAAAYGWHEADILAMSPVRRSYYLHRVLA